MTVFLLVWIFTILLQVIILNASTMPIGQIMFRKISALLNAWTSWMNLGSGPHKWPWFVVLITPVRRLILRYTAIAMVTSEPVMILARIVVHHRLACVGTRTYGIRVGSCWKKNFAKIKKKMFLQNFLFLFFGIFTKSFFFLHYPPRMPYVPLRICRHS